MENSGEFNFFLRKSVGTVLKGNKCEKICLDICSIWQNSVLQPILFSEEDWLHDAPARRHLPQAIL